MSDVMSRHEIRELASALDTIMRSGDREIGRALSLLGRQDLERLARLAEAELA